MHLAWFRFYEELNDFLPKDKRKILFPYHFSGNPSVKDAIEASGVPHVEVDLIIVNNESVPFSYNLREGDIIAVYPVFESMDISGVTHLRKKPLRNLKFIADVHLGKLAKKMRLCGLDTYYEKNLTDKDLIGIALSQKRVILTRDTGLLKNKAVTHGYRVRSEKPEIQIEEIITRFDLKNQLKPFSRCIECNSLLEDVSKETVANSLPPKTRLYYSKFKTCPSCKRIYWEGSHYLRMKKHLNDLSL